MTNNTDPFHVSSLPPNLHDDPAYRDAIELARRIGAANNKRMWTDNDGGDDTTAPSWSTMTTATAASEMKR